VIARARCAISRERRAEQLTDADEDTTWNWDVRATQAGKQRLTVTLTAIIDMEGTEGTRDVSTFYREVEVEALPKLVGEHARHCERVWAISRSAVACRSNGDRCCLGILVCPQEIAPKAESSQVIRPEQLETELPPYDVSAASGQSSRTSSGRNVIQ